MALIAWSGLDPDHLERVRAVCAAALDDPTGAPSHARSHRTSHLAGAANRAPAPTVPGGHP